MTTESTAGRFSAVWQQRDYRAAVAVFAVVFIGYLVTVAPTVTFWDAGEFLAASRILGIPHPPGTPFFVFLTHVWGMIFPFGGYAFRINTLTALFSSCSAAFMFLVVLRGLQRGEDTDPLWTYGGAAAAALCSAFVFTVWQNSNESEVYMVSAFLIAVSSWLAILWRSSRGTARAAHVLLLMVYLGALSIGNHLMTLLVGPALIGYMGHVLYTEPLDDEGSRRVERGQWLVLASVWALLIGVGLGSTSLTVLAGVMLALAGAYSMLMAGRWGFTVAVLALSAVGVSTYLFLYIRAGLHPFINEADPSTWQSLLAVIRREQYPPRLPIDNPIYPSGPGNPGRSLQIIGLQLQNYLQYFDWQWANGLARTKPVFAIARLPFTLLFTTLGIVGAAALRQRDRSAFWLLVLIFLITGPGLMGYMNFKPGFSLGYDLYPDATMHEVRERDYFFTISFQVWGLLAGIGIAALYRVVRDAISSASARRLAAPVFALALLPYGLNFTAASRAHGPDPQLARDFAYDLLQSVEPYGILFTNGDNDTFPLWYLQEVEGIRQDVSVVNLSLGNTDWYIRQLRDNPVRPFVPEQAPFYANLAPAQPPPPLHTLSDADIESMVPQRLRDSLRFRVGLIDHTLPANTPLFIKDMLMLRLIAENAGRPEGQRRPIFYSTTAGSSNWINLGLDRYVVQEALTLKVYANERPDLSRLGQGLFGAVDIPRTDSLAWNIYRYAGLFDVDSLDLYPTERNIATNLTLPFLTLSRAYQLRGDLEAARRNLERAYHLTADPSYRAALQRLTAPGSTGFGDTAVAPAAADTGPPGN